MFRRVELVIDFMVVLYEVANTHYFKYPNLNFKVR